MYQMIQEEVICYSWMEKDLCNANYFKKDFEEKHTKIHYSLGLDQEH